MLYVLLALLAAVGALSMCLASVVGNGGYHTCIIGAGPGGLQLGHFLNRKNRNYAVFERAGGPGHFFERFPIHRQLISVNKRNTGRSNPQFNLRHDWNSLLGNEEAVPLTQRTKERFPDADLLVTYLREFAAEQERSGRIFYRTAVDSVQRDKASDTFTLMVQVDGKDLQSVTCDVVVSAIGMWSPNIQDITGIELTVGYEDLPQGKFGDSTSGEIFEAKSVAILGLGNAAFETGVIPKRLHMHATFCLADRFELACR
jgi:cation diffusion facilitator CzcD-associated flavoprotein CzcO